MLPGSGGGGGGGSSRGAPLPKMFVVDNTRGGGIGAESAVVTPLTVPTARTAGLGSAFGPRNISEPATSGFRASCGYDGLWPLGELQREDIQRSDALKYMHLGLQY